MNPLILSRLLRCDQWIKNLFVLAPAFFGRVLTDSTLWGKLTIGVVLFSLTSSSIYILNDIIDRDRDRLHPTKKERPIASGRVTHYLAWCISIGLLLTVILLSIILLPTAMIALTLCILASYWILNVCYSYLLKRIAIVDILTIGVGFVLRVVLGGVLAGVVLSGWLIVMTLLLSLFLALAKRRDDYLIYERSGITMRQAIKGYNRIILDYGLKVLAVVLLSSYTLYTLSPEIYSEPGGGYLYLTALPVLVGLIRYLRIIFVEEHSGNPAKIVYHDTTIILCILVWCGLFGILRYLL